MQKIDGKLMSVNEDDIDLLNNNPDEFWKDVNELSIFSFKNLKSLKELNIPSNVTKINEYFVSDCPNLEKIFINANVEKLERNCFESNVNLKEIFINKNIKTISKECFYMCKGLERVKLNIGLKSIEDEAFAYCSSLKRIIIPDTVEELGTFSFYGCSNLERIKLSRRMKTISASSFSNCKSLKEIILPYNIKFLGELSFENCSNLTDIVIQNKKVNVNRGAFENVPLKYIVENNDEIILTNSLEKYENMNYVTIEDMKKFFLDFEIENLFPLEMSIEELKSVMEKCEKANVKMPIRYVNKYLKLNSSKAMNLKYYKQIYKLLKGESLENIDILCNFGETIGLFQYPIVEMHMSKSGNIITEKVDYSQKAGEFLKECINKEKIKVSHFNYVLSKLENNGFKRDFALFILQDGNFESILKVIHKNKDFLANVYNHFEEVQATNTNKNGTRILKPTIQKFVSYFNDNKFINSDNYADIAKELGKFYDDQKYFDEAIEIRKEFENKKISPNILSVDLEEKTLRKISEVKNSILKLGKETLLELKEASNGFTFEWLKKDDPHNYTLGKYCSCCAHLSQIGDGIAIASILHPDVQNIVLRDVQGTIVAKSTLYINREQGYGVFNTVEVSSIIPESAKKRIYDKYIMGIKIFAELYNQENPEHPLKKINVGMDFNSLHHEIKQNNEKDEILEPIHYKEYSVNKAYDGDSLNLQYNIWKKTK